MLFRSLTSNTVFRIRFRCTSHWSWRSTKDEYSLHFKIPLCCAEINAGNFEVKRRNEHLYRLIYGRCVLLDWQKMRDYSIFRKPWHRKGVIQAKVINMLESAQIQKGFYLFSEPFFVPTAPRTLSFLVHKILPIGNSFLLSSSLGKYAITLLIVLIKRKELITRRGLINHNFQTLSEYDPNINQNPCLYKLPELFELVSQELSQDVSNKFKNLQPLMAPSLFKRICSPKFTNKLTSPRRRLLNLKASDLYDNNFVERTNTGSLMNSSKQEAEQQKNPDISFISGKERKRKHLTVDGRYIKENSPQSNAAVFPGFVYDDKPFRLIDIKFRTEDDNTYADLTVLFVAVYKQNLVRKSWPDMHKDYGFGFPRVIYANFVLTKKVKPTVDSDFLISHLNYIVM